jgi:hypothetical protein
MTVISGRVSFEENPFPERSGGGGKLDENDFIRLKTDGDYMIMLLSATPFIYQEHWAVNARNEKRSLRCAVRNCSLCNESAELLASADPVKKEAGKAMAAKSKFAIEAFLLGKGDERLGSVTGRAGILEFGTQVFGQIRSISNTLKKVGGTLDRAILSINRDKRRGPSAMYTVTQVPVAYKLTAEQEENLRKFNERGMDLAKIYDTPTDEANMRRLGRIGEAAAQTQNGATVLGSTQQTGGTKFSDAW